MVYDTDADTYLNSTVLLNYMNFNDFYDSIKKDYCDDACSLKASAHQIVKIQPPDGEISIMLISRDPPEKYFKKYYSPVVNSSKSLIEKRQDLMDNGVPNQVIKRIRSFQKRNPDLINYSDNEILKLETLLKSSYWTHLCKCYTVKKNWSRECPKKWLEDEIKLLPSQDVKMIIPLGTDVGDVVKSILGEEKFEGIAYPLPHHSGSNFDWTREDRADKTAAKVKHLFDGISKLT